MSQSTGSLPPEFGGIQYNYCRTPTCKNYGVIPNNISRRGKSAVEIDGYKFTGGGTSVPVLQCLHCGHSIPLKNNAAIAEELAHISKNISERSVVCPNPECVSNKVGQERSPNFVKHGTTKSGAERFRCKHCGTTFTPQRKTTRISRRKGIDLLVFRLLINKMPMRRICETADIQPAVLYGQIHRTNKLCLQFAAEQERKLLNGVCLRRVYLAIDRQEYTFNWGTHMDRRNVVLRAIGTSDNATGYVFAMNLDFDPELNAELVERDAILSGDYDRPYHQRKYARVWLQREYRDRYRTIRRLKKRKNNGTITQDIVDAYCADEMSSHEVEPRESIDARLPSMGMQVHSEYTLIAHFMYLNRLLANVEKIRIFMDQDTGMRAASLGAFIDRIKDRTADVFFVRIRKDMSVQEKKTLKAQGESLIKRALAANPSKTRSDIITQVMCERIESMLSLGDSKDRWLLHPFPDMSEPEKAVCYLTDYSDYPLDHLAALYRKASLHSIDRFFMQLRRRVSILERPVHTSSGAGRVWFGYAAYNPAVAVSLMEIFRVVHNYVLVGEDGCTPAMRLGLSDRAYSLSDLLTY